MRPLVVASLLVLYVVWGSTYFAMHIVLGALPPFLMAGPRFLAAGLVLFAILRLRGVPTPTRREWLGAGGVGIVLLVFGNGFVALGQRSVDSGVAATVVATMPLWAALFASIWGERPTMRGIAGLALGFLGTIALQRGGSISFGSLDSILLLIAPIAWAFGSVLSRHIAVPKGTMNTATQMIAGGGVMTIIALARDEHPRAPITASVVIAILYLVVFGSLLALSAYGYLLQNTRPAIATSYAYVNPVVALAFGSALGGERLSASRAIACSAMIAGVLVVTLRPSAAHAARA